MNNREEFHCSDCGKIYKQDADAIACCDRGSKSTWRCGKCNLFYSNPASAELCCRTIDKETVELQNKFKQAGADLWNHILNVVLKNSSKQRVNPVIVEKKNDCYKVTEKEGIEHIIYLDNYDKIVNILMSIDETKFKDTMIPAEIVAGKLCEIHPELETKMLRPTGEYYAQYHLVLKILDNERYIDYYKDGTILKNKKFLDITPIKRGVDKWVDLK